jgi:hypothetical protein
MNIQTAFFTCLVIAALGIIVAFINILSAPSRAMRSGSFTSLFVVHIIAGLCYVLGGLGTIGFGIAWIVTYLKG